MQARLKLVSSYDDVYKFSKRYVNTVNGELVTNTYKASASLYCGITSIVAHLRLEEDSLQLPRRGTW